MARPTSDEPFDRLLRRTLERDAPAGAVCPDFEQLAAFLEGGLPPSEAHDVERHASSCPRCAAVLATTLASDTAASPPPVPAPPFWRRWRWAIPLATAATVVGLWVATSDPLQRTQAPVPAAEPFDAVSPQAEAVPEERLAVGERVAPAPSEAPRADDTRSLAAAGQGLPPAPVAEGPPQSISPPAAASARAAAASTKQEAERAEASRAQAPTAPTAAPAPARGAFAAGATAQSGERAVRDALAAREVGFPIVASPAGGVLWRARGNVVERSTDAGATWTVEYTATAPVQGGSAASPDVAWFFGAGGLVLRRTGEGWTVVSPPAAGVDIVALTAMSADAATVTLSDGRQFATSDGGVTWALR